MAQAVYVDERISDEPPHWEVWDDETFDTLMRFDPHPTLTKAVVEDIWNATEQIESGAGTDDAETFRKDHQHGRHDVCRDPWFHWIPGAAQQEQTTE